jgi:hypothetical protein
LTEEHYKVPKQNEVVARFRNAGFDEKVRVGTELRHAIDGILENVGLCVYFGHSDAAFVRLMAAQSLYLDNQIRECYYITQSQATSEIRHRQLNPRAKPGTNGNRVVYDDIVAGMGYYHRFIEVPLTIIGLDFDPDNILG